MAEWMIFQSPSVILLAGIAVVLNLFDRKEQASKGILTFVSAVPALLAAAILFLSGASLRELAAVLSVFLLLNIGETK